MKNITQQLLVLALLLVCHSISGQSGILFNWDTNATDNGASISETIADVTVTLTGDSELEILNLGGGLNTEGNTASTFTNVTTLTFTFNEPVIVKSIRPIDLYGGSLDYTFTPTGGSNDIETGSLSGGSTTDPVELNWVGVTSFTVASSGSGMGFDDLLIYKMNNSVLFDWDTNATDNGASISEEIGGITAILSGDSELEILNIGGGLNTEANTASTFTSVTSLTFTFSEPVAIKSIRPIDLYGGSLDYTFTPTGGDNKIKTGSLSGGSTTDPVELNWVGVSSFTVTSSGSGMGFDDLLVYGMEKIIIFEWETATENGDPFHGVNYESITETIDEVEVTVSGLNLIGDPTLSLNDFGGTSNFVISGTTTSVTFTFDHDQPIGVNSIVAWDIAGEDVDVTFTPTGGTNTPVTVSLVGGVAPSGFTINLNWMDITSFTVTTITGANFGFGDLSVYTEETLSTDDYRPQSENVIAYPNPVEHMLYIKNVLDLKSVKVYNSLGQQVLQSKVDNINMSQLSKGVYFVEIETRYSTETKKIIKK